MKYQVKINVLVEAPENHVRAVTKLVHETAQELLVGAGHVYIHIIGASVDEDAIPVDDKPKEPKISDWVKALGQWHQCRSGESSTICGMPMLACTSPSTPKSTASTRSPGSTDATS